MAAYAALASLVNTTEQIMIHPRLSASLDNNQIKALHEKAGLLLDFLEGYNYGVVSKEVEDLERRIACAAHEAEDVIESHVFDKIHARSVEISRSCSLHLQQIVEGMDAILEKAYESKEKERFRLREEEKQPSNSRPDLLETGETGMVGFEDELIQLMDELTNQRASRHIISIVGMGGIGKTTLAHNLYHSSLIKQHFDVRAWATVSQQHNAKEIISQLLSSLGTVGESGEQLHKTLYGRRYVIILDDIWSAVAWDEVRHFLPDDKNGSRVVITTRLSSVANDCGSSLFQKKLLDDNRSWELFCSKAFKNEDCPNELEEVGKEIVRLCKGLPLSVVVIGGSLHKSPRTLRHWKNVAKDIKSVPNSKEKHESLDVLISSYHHLPPRLKPCFLHFGVSKISKYKTDVSKIIKLWVAEGFLRSDGTRALEEIAEDYIKDLVDRNLVAVSRRSDNGKVKSCDVHDLLRDLCLKVAEQQEFFYVTEGFTRDTERRLMYTDFLSGIAKPSPLARSIMICFYGVPKLKLNGHKLLRVLDVSHHGVHNSVEESFAYVNLRHLALRHHISWKIQRVWKLPASISLVWNLQSLIFEDIPLYNIVVAPVAIWTMRQLRHIKFPTIYLPDPAQVDLFVLGNLQTLKTAFNLRLRNNAIPNIMKLHPRYDPRLQGFDDSLIECLCNLSQFHKLASLKLETGRMQPSFPTSLNKLSLRYCQLHWDDLTVIGSLPLLEVLKLDYHSVTEGEEWSHVDGQFLRLKFLKLDACGPRCWNAESCHFPVLEKLVLHFMWKLEEIPLGMGEIPTLELSRPHPAKLATRERDSRKRNLK